MLNIKYAWESATQYVLYNFIDHHHTANIKHNEIGHHTQVGSLPARGAPPARLNNPK